MLNVYLSQSGESQSFLTLVSFEIDALEILEATTILGKPGAVYAPQASARSAFFPIVGQRTFSRWIM